MAVILLGEYAQEAYTENDKPILTKLSNLIDRKPGFSEQMNYLLDFQRLWIELTLLGGVDNK